jgi:hypothetical protein
LGPGGQRMQWSQLKRRVESMFADTLRGRVAVHSTTYHQWNDSRDAGRVWMTIDGREVLTLCSNYRELYPTMPAALVKQLQRLGISSAPGNGGPADLRDKLVLSRREVHQLMFGHLSLSIDEVLASDHPFVRGLGMLDRRVGKRRLAALRKKEQHPWPRLLLDLRCEAETLNQGPAEQSAERTGTCRIADLLRVP